MGGRWQGARGSEVSYSGMSSVQFTGILCSHPIITCLGPLPCDDKKSRVSLPQAPSPTLSSPPYTSSNSSDSRPEVPSGASRSFHGNCSLLLSFCGSLLYTHVLPKLDSLLSPKRSHISHPQGFASVSSTPRNSLPISLCPHPHHLTPPPCVPDLQGGSLMPQLFIPPMLTKGMGW